MSTLLKYSAGISITSQIIPLGSRACLTSPGLGSYRLGLGLGSRIKGRGELLDDGGLTQRVLRMPGAACPFCLALIDSRRQDAAQPTEALLGPAGPGRTCLGHQLHKD